MAKPATCSNENDALEIIELSIDSSELLTRAFDLIADLCQAADQKVSLNEIKESPMIH